MMGLQPEQKKCFKTSYSSADQKVFCVYCIFNSPSKLHSKSNNYSIHYLWRGLCLGGKVTGR